MTQNDHSALVLGVMRRIMPMQTEYFPCCKLHCENELCTMWSSTGIGKKIRARLRYFVLVVSAPLFALIPNIPDQCYLLFAHG